MKLQLFFLLLAQVFQCGMGVGYGPSLNPREISGVSLATGFYYEQLQLNLTSQLGAGRFYRVGLWPGQYYDDNTGTVLFQRATDLDPIFALGASYGLVPVILFSYYPNLGEGNGLGIPVGGYNKWYQIGQAYARYYGPGGELAQKYNLGSSWQGPLFTAFNEADICFEAYGYQAWDLSLYYNAILGLAQGLHSINPSIVFFPGGYAAPNRDAVYDLYGMGPLLAPLWNNGTLNGIDLHIYSSYSNNLAFASSAQSTFNKVKQASGITADINYIMTEYNFYYNFGVQTEQYGAQEFLTCMWDGWGVVKNDGHTSATAVTLVYDLYQPLTASTTYGLDYSLTPWDGTARADTLLRTLNLTAGMQFTYLDPLVTGIFILQGQSANLQQKMWVWQNRVGWSSITGTSFTFSAGSLNGFNTLEIWGWDGLRNTLSINVGSGSYVLTNLNQGETYMFLAIGPLSSSPLPDLIVQSVSWSPANPTTGQAVTFNAMVKNQGNAATPAGVVIGVGFSVDGTELTWSDNSTTSLAPGATRILVADGGTNNGANTWTATTGTHTILAYVDDVNRITESNENNNQLTATVTVTAGLPDLIVQSISWSPTHPRAGQSVVFSCVVKNQGNAATPAGVVIGVGFSVDGTEVTWSDTDSTSLAAGATVALTADYGTSGVNYWVATTGTHTILAYVDDVNRIVESNENNNQLTATVTI